MTLKAGAASVVITPPVGVEIAGYGFGPSLGILDNLEAQVLYLEQGDEKAAIITADLLTFGTQFVDRVRARVESTCDIPGENVLLAASHSHSSPTAKPFRQWGSVDDAYLQTLAANLAGAVSMAYGKAQEARLGFGIGQVQNISENRRREKAFFDPAVPALRIEDAAGRPMALLFNFACHPVSLHSYRNLLSPDYPGYARDTIRQILGSHVVVMFSLGAAGDINPAGYRPNQTTPQRSRQIGAILGCEVSKVALDPTIQENPPLIVRHELVQLPVAPLPPAAELRRMFRDFAAEAADKQAAGRPWVELSVILIQRDWAAEALRAQEAGQIRSTIPCEVMALRLGDVALLAAPLEIFTETGLAIKRLSPARLTLISTNSNGGIGYLPTQDAYQEDDYTNPEGLAPKVYGLYALAEEAEPLFQQSAIRMLQALF